MFILYCFNFNNCICSANGIYLIIIIIIIISSSSSSSSSSITELTVE